LVEIALGLPRQFDGLVQKVHFHKLAFYWILSPILTIVIPPAKTGNDNNNKTAVITTAHANKISFDPKTINILKKTPVLKRIRSPL